jgi:hypothetical protein
MATNHPMGRAVDAIENESDRNLATEVPTSGTTKESNGLQTSNPVNRETQIPKKMFQQALKSAALFALVMPYPQLAHANPTIIDGPATGTQTINGNDSLIITPTGSITAIINAIRANNSLNTIINSGAITTTGNNGNTIDAPDGSNRFINSGSISTTGDYAHGIIADSGGNFINNSGSISTTGAGSHSINAFSVGNTIINSGSINSTGASYANGISAATNYNTITNLGSVNTTAYGGYGISAGSFSAITNSGLISSSGDYGEGIDAANSNTITNSGSINMSGALAIGIRVYDSNTINNSGSISTTGHGIYAYGNANTLTNTGSIIGTAALGGIYVQGDSNTIINPTSGSIHSAGIGIEIYGLSNVITNDGLISSAANGINLYSSDDNTIANHGSIIVGGAHQSGIYMDFSNSNAISNTGSIIVSGAGGYGINAVNNSSSNTISNSGSISVSGAGGYGFSIQGNTNTITNSGSINVSGTGGYGIYAQGSNNTVTNSGDIISKDGYAVYFNGSGNTLNSVNNLISGSIYLGSNARVSLATGANYSKLYTFGGSLSAINESGPLPLFKNISTQQAGTHDPTIFASSADSLADMTNTIASMAPNRFNGSDNQHPFWAKGFGMTASYAGTEATLTHRNNVYGAAIGYDVKRSKDLTIGLMGGYGQSHQWADGITMPSFNTSSDDGFLGIYGQKRWQTVALDFALYGGLQNVQQQRDVNDNLAYAGQSSAKASYQGWWISPELGVTLNAGDINGWSVLPTARLRYAQQWLGGYTETGAGAANANVNGRNVAIGQGFIGVGTRKTIKTQMGKDTKMVFDGQIGYIYRGVVGDTTVGVTMIGQSLALPTEARSRRAVAVSAGVTIDLSNAVALKLRGDFEGGEGINDVSGGWAGLSVKF